MSVKSGVTSVLVQDGVALCDFLGSGRTGRLVVAGNVTDDLVLSLSITFNC